MEHTAKGDSLVKPMQGANLCPHINNPIQYYVPKIRKTGRLGVYNKQGQPNKNGCPFIVGKMKTMFFGVIAGLMMAGGILVFGKIMNMIDEWIEYFLKKIKTPNPMYCRGCNHLYFGVHGKTRCMKGNDDFKCARNERDWRIKKK